LVDLGQIQISVRGAFLRPRETRLSIHHREDSILHAVH
jgi:hypothetical protein